jgi:hypothetical protein
VKAGKLFSATAKVEQTRASRNATRSSICDD